MDELQKYLDMMQQELDRFMAPDGPLDQFMKACEKTRDDIAQKIKDNTSDEVKACLNEQRLQLQKILGENQQRIREKCFTGRMQQAREIMSSAVSSGETQQAFKEMDQLRRELSQCMNAELKVLGNQMMEIGKIVKACMK